MDEAPESEEEAVDEVVVLLLERPVKTERRLGLGALAVERDRTWATWSGGSLEALVEGRSEWSRSSGGLTTIGLFGDEADSWEACMADERMTPTTGDMPFDPKRMIYGGFEVILDSAKD